MSLGHKKKWSFYSKVLPGNMLGIAICSDLLAEKALQRSRFRLYSISESTTLDKCEQNLELHYPNLVKRNSRAIGQPSILYFTATSPRYEGIIFWKEKCVGISKWFYSFYGNEKSAKKKATGYDTRKNNIYSLDVLRKKHYSFTTIVLEFNFDLPIEFAHKV